MSTPLYDKQKLMRDFSTGHKRVLNFSDAGTGKTAATLHAIANLKAKALVMAPKAIIEPSWVEDCRTFTPALTIMPAYVANRSLALALRCKRHYQ